MATKNVTWKMRQRQGTAAEWAATNPILAAGEFGYDTTNGTTKIGDGKTVWSKLPAFATSRLTFASAAWGDIARIAASGEAARYFNVGDEKVVELSTGEAVTLVILGFNHDDLAAGGKAPISIGMKNCLATYYPMNSGSTNAGGWDQSKMRTETMQTLLSQLPSDLQAVIKQVSKKASAGSQSSNITTSTDKLFLFSEVEIDGTTAAVYVNEGTQYEYWRTVKNGQNSADRIKYASNGGGAACSWWLRSPHTGGTHGFRGVNASGSVGSGNAYTSRGVSFGFCV